MNEACIRHLPDPAVPRPGHLVTVSLEATLVTLLAELRDLERERLTYP